MLQKQHFREAFLPWRQLPTRVRSSLRVGLLVGPPKVMRRIANVNHPCCHIRIFDLQSIFLSANFPSYRQACNLRPGGIKPIDNPVSLKPLVREEYVSLIVSFK